MTHGDPTTTELGRAVRELRAENDRLRRQVDELVARVEHVDERSQTRPPVATGERTSRRDLLRLAGAGAAGAVGATLLSAAPAAASTGTMLYGASNNSGTSATDLTGGSSQYLLALHGTDTSGNGSVVRIDDNNGFSGTTGVLFDGLEVLLSCRGDAVNVSNNGTGGGVNSSVGSAGSGTAVSGFSFNGVGVSGSSTHGVAVQADISLSFGGAPAMQSSTAGHAGEALLGTISNATNPSNGIDITTAGTGSALNGLITNQSSSAPAAFVATEGTGYGLWAQQLGGEVAAVYGDCSISGGPGVQGFAGGTGVPGVHGLSQEGPGLLGECVQTDNTSPAVSGTTVGKGHAVSGQITNAASTSHGVYGQTNGKGSGVYGQITNSASNAPAVTGQTNGIGPAVAGAATGSGPAVSAVVFGTGSALVGGIVNPANTQPGVTASTVGTGPAIQGQATGSGIGVNASSTNGRGAVLAGGAAQAQLVPSGASTHPSSGKAGDLFVDSSARLWFCTVTGSPATWKQVQVA